VDGLNWTARGILSALVSPVMSALLPHLPGDPVKLVRMLIAAAAALVAAVALQTAGASGASAAPVHVNDCGTCWQIVQE